MYHIIGTVKQMEVLSASIMGCIPSQILERLEQRIETLQECYGADRDLEADLGGYVVLFPSMTLEDEPDSIEDYSGQFKLRIPKSLHRLLAEHSKKEGVSMNRISTVYICFQGMMQCI